MGRGKGLGVSFSFGSARVARLLSCHGHRHSLNLMGFTFITILTNACSTRVCVCVPMCVFVCVRVYLVDFTRPSKRQFIQACK